MIKVNQTGAKLLIEQVHVRVLNSLVIVLRRRPPPKGRFVFCVCDQDKRYSYSFSPTLHSAQWLGSHKRRAADVNCSCSDFQTASGNKPGHYVSRTKKLILSYSIQMNFIAVLSNCRSRLSMSVSLFIFFIMC